MDDKDFVSGLTSVLCRDTWVPKDPRASAARSQASPGSSPPTLIVPAAEDTLPRVSNSVTHLGQGIGMFGTNPASELGYVFLVSACLTPGWNLQLA